jgi:manganese oxidase
MEAELDAHEDRDSRSKPKEDMGGMKHGSVHTMGSDAKTLQLSALAGLTSFRLISGMVRQGFSVNLRLSARDVDASIMPSGMINTFDLPGAAMKPRQVTYIAPKGAKVDQIPQLRMENGVKIFDIETSVKRWNILPDVAVEAYAYNRQVPGPRLLSAERDVRINFRSGLSESTMVYWRGLIVPNEMDGPANVTQHPVPPGDSYTYEFEVGQGGAFFYHSHDHPDRQQALGLCGALLIAPKDPSTEGRADLDYTIQLQEWLKREWLTYPAILMEGALPNYFTINGRAYPSTDNIAMKVGQTIKLRFIGTNNNFVHPMHFHGGPFENVVVDGINLRESARLQADTSHAGPGQRYGVIGTARKPGRSLVHRHIPHHAANNNVEQNGGGGLMLVLNVT